MAFRPTWQASANDRASDLGGASEIRVCGQITEFSITARSSIFTPAPITDLTMLAPGLQRNLCLLSIPDRSLPAWRSQRPHRLQIERCYLSSRQILVGRQITLGRADITPVFSPFIEYPTKRQPAFPKYLGKTSYSNERFTSFAIDVPELPGSRI
jgi:hypothetical protein